MEQKQEMGTVGNLCASKCISKQKKGLDPCVRGMSHICQDVDVQTDVLTDESLLTSILI